MWQHSSTHIATIFFTVRGSMHGLSGLYTMQCKLHRALIYTENLMQRAAPSVHA